MTTTHQEIEQAVRSPQFSHGRAGDRLYRGKTLIYHFHPTSPSGVHLVCVGNAATVDPLIKQFQRTSPLSPTEGK